LFITYKIATELPRNFIREIDDKDYEKFFQSNLIVKDNTIITFEMFKIAFEKKVIASEKETIEKIIKIAIERMPFLSKLSDNELDQMIATLNTPKGYAIRDIFTFFLENIGDIMHDRANEIGNSCFDIFIELVDLNEKSDSQNTNTPDMN